METKSKVACVQMDIQYGSIEANTKKVVGYLQKAAEAGCALALFPECALQGYCMNTKDEVEEQAVAADDSSIREIIAACEKHKIMAAVGFLEKRGGETYNSAALLGPEGLLQVYSKMHLPYIGADKFVAQGQPPLPPVDTPIGRLSMLICYDVRFPELSRYYALQGADVLLIPTNWPLGSEKTREIFPISRAFENGVYVMAANRVGDERGSHFIGGSRVISPSAQLLAQAGSEETMLVTDIDVAVSRKKDFASVEGNWSIDIFKDRRPEVFGNMTARK